jgi:ATP-dependent DNA ligase
VATIPYKMCHLRGYVKREKRTVHLGWIDFLEWTGANHLRHAKFVSLRDDKDPRKVVKEITYELGNTSQAYS